MSNLKEKAMRRLSLVTGVFLPFVLIIGCAGSTKSVAEPPKGSLSKTVIRQVVHGGLNEMERCVGANAAPGTQGRFVVKFIIGVDGSVTKVSIVQDELENSDLEKCIVDLVYKWRFPPPEGGGHVIVTYPFDLVAPPVEPSDTESQS